MSQNNQTKTYIRVDASGRDIAGTNVLRKSTPKTGNWREVESYSCCNPFTLLEYTPLDLSLAVPSFSLLCDANVVAVVNGHTATTTLIGIVDELNAVASVYGLFSVSGIKIQLRLKQEVADALCPVGALTFTVIELV